MLKHRIEKIFLICIFLISAWMFITSCGKKDLHTGHSIRIATPDEVGKEAICPVTKNKFKITHETKAVDYKGQTYYFCCPGCDTEFIKQPEKFITGIESQSRPFSVVHGAKAPTPDKEILYWTCSMHPQVRQNKPGKCPVCGMELIPVYKAEEDKIVVDEKKVKQLGIKSEPVKIVHLTKKIRLPAKVAYDNELYLAQQEYLSSFKNWQQIKDTDTEQKSRIKEALEAAEFRLSLLGYTQQDIQELQKFAEPDKNLIYPGEKVWMHAEIYEYDLSLIKPGQKVVATTPAYPSEKFTGVVQFIEPVLNPQTRSAKARIVFDNPQRKLKLEMYTDLEIEVSLGKHLSIPQTALIDTGTRKVVYLDLGQGRYKMQEVKTGFETEDYVQVLSGLKVGDMVVTDGNFMLDSQSTLTGGQALLYGAAEEINPVRDKK